MWYCGIQLYIHFTFYSNVMLYIFFCQSLYLLNTILTHVYKCTIIVLYFIDEDYVWYKIPPLYEIIVTVILQCLNNMSFCWYICVSLLILCEWIVMLTFIETGSRVACWIYVYVTLYMYIIICEKLSILTFFKNGAWNKYFGCFLLKMFSLFVWGGFFGSIFNFHLFLWYTYLLLYILLL